MPKGFRKSDGKPIGVANKGRPSPRKNGLYIPCVTCNKIFYVIKCRIGITTHCSKNCHNVSMKGKPNLGNVGINNGNWSGGRHKNFHGYIIILNKSGKYDFEHRIIMEEYLGRKLTSKEVVHHINGIPTDNRIKNLQLFANQSNHIKFHKPLGTKFPHKT